MSKSAPSRQIPWDYIWHDHVLCYKERQDVPQAPPVQVSAPAQVVRLADFRQGAAAAREAFSCALASAWQDEKLAVPAVNVDASDLAVPSLDDVVAASTLDVQVRPAPPDGRWASLQNPRAAIAATVAAAAGDGRVTAAGAASSTSAAYQRSSVLSPDVAQRQPEAAAEPLLARTQPGRGVVRKAGAPAAEAAQQPLSATAAHRGPPPVHDPSSSACSPAAPTSTVAQSPAPIATAAASATLEEAAAAELALSGHVTREDVAALMSSHAWVFKWSSGDTENDGSRALDGGGAYGGEGRRTTTATPEAARGAAAAGEAAAAAGEAAAGAGAGAGAGPSGRVRAPPAAVGEAPSVQEPVHPRQRLVGAWRRNALVAAPELRSLQEALDPTLEVGPDGWAAEVEAQAAEAAAQPLAKKQRLMGAAAAEEEEDTGEAQRVAVPAVAPTTTVDAPAIAAAGASGTSPPLQGRRQPPLAQQQQQRDDEEDDVLVHVAVYPPGRADLPQQEVLLLGSSPLGQLCSSIKCSRQAVHVASAAAGPHPARHAFLFIEGTFYVATEEEEQDAEEVGEGLEQRSLRPMQQQLRRRRQEEARVDGEGDEEDDDDDEAMAAADSLGEGAGVRRVATAATGVARHAPPLDALPPPAAVSSILNFCRTRGFVPNHLDGTDVSRGVVLCPALAAAGQGEPPSLGTPRVVSLRGTRLADIPALRVSSRPTAVYCHVGGCCEHLVQVKDVRQRLRSGRGTVADPADYPLQLLPHRSLHKVRKCGVCTRRDATRVTFDDPLAVSNPCFMCDACFGMLHYDSPDSGGSRLVANVKVLPYGPPSVR